MIDITPERISKWCRITKEDTSNRFSLICEPRDEDLPEIQSAMKEGYEAIKRVNMEIDLDESFAQAFIFEWAFYIKALNKMESRKSNADQRHYIPLSYLANFGISNKNHTNVTLKALKFYSADGENKILTCESGLVTGNSNFLYGGRDSYMDKHEILFGEFESRLTQCLRFQKNHIVKRNYSLEEPISIEEEIQNQGSMEILQNSLYVRIIISIFVILLECRHFLKTPADHINLSNRLDNISIMALGITCMVRKKWYWVHADDTGELSLVNRGVIRLPEEDDALFFSLSRVWGLFLPSSKLSNFMAEVQGSNFKVTEVLPISKLHLGVGTLGETVGYKINNILMHNKDERELYYPMAESLAFHPEWPLAK